MGLDQKNVVGGFLAQALDFGEFLIQPEEHILPVNVHKGN
jgi:hypothetical protein